MAKKSASKAPAKKRAPRKRTHLMNVDVGLYVLRYVATRHPAAAPQVHVGPAPGNADYVAIIRSPGMTSNTLSEPGDCIFVHADRRSSISLVVKPGVRGGSIDAEVRLERVTSAVAGSAVAAHLPAATAAVAPVLPAGEPALAETRMEVLAHVSHRGDVTAKPGEWICGPDLPIAIEGIQIEWPNRPAGVELTYAVAAGGREPRRFECTSGGFAGSRGCAAPLVGLQAGLSGPRADQFELRCDALFLAAPVLSRRGRTVSLAGPTGHEPLVGLRLSVEPRALQPARTQTPDNAVARTVREPGSVRVYRAAPAARPRRAEHARA